MKRVPVLLLLLLPVAVLVWFVTTQNYSAPQLAITPTNRVLAPTPNLDCIPTFPDGDGPYYHPDSPTRTKIVPDQNNGQRLIISGKVLANDCKTPFGNVTLDIWQANEEGNYQDEWYRGRVTTTSDGSYQFETVAPKGYGAGTAYRPPHIHFKVWQNGKLIITSEMFMPEAKNQGIEDAYILKVSESEQNGRKTLNGKHDIVLPVAH